MSYQTDPRVDAYIGSLPGWQQAICREVRDLVHAADGMGWIGVAGVGTVSGQARAPC